MSYSQSDTSNKIPYQFCPIPYEFFRKEFIHDPAMMTLIFYIFKRIRTIETKISIKSNGYHEVVLSPFEFIFGRLSCSRETELTERQIRTRLERLIALGYLERQTTSSSTSSSTSSFVRKTTSSYTVYRIVSEAFSKITVQQFSASNDQQNDQQFDHKQEVQEEPRDLVLKKETRKKKDVHNFETPLPPKGGVVVPLSFSIDEKIKNTFSKEDIDSIDFKLRSDPISISSPSITTIKRWLKYGLHRLIYSIQMLEREIERKRRLGDIIPSKEGWIQDCLAKGWDQKEIFVERNKNYLEKFREDHKIMSLKIHKKCARDHARQFDFEFTMNPDEFESYVNRKYAQ